MINIGSTLSRKSESSAPKLQKFLHGFLGGKEDVYSSDLAFYGILNHKKFMKKRVKSKYKQVRETEGDFLIHFDDGYP